MPTFGGGGSPTQRFLPSQETQTWLNLAGKTLPHHRVTHKTQQTVAVPTAEILQSEATAGQQPKRPGASSFIRTFNTDGWAFMSSPSRYGIRTCLRPVRRRLAHFWDSRQESTDLRVEGTLSHTHTSLCGEKRPRTFLGYLSHDLTEDPAWAMLSSASPQTIYSGLGVFEEARELQMPLHHTPRDLSTCLP